MLSQKQQENKTISIWTIIFGVMAILTMVGAAFNMDNKYKFLILSFTCAVFFMIAMYFAEFFEDRRRYKGFKVALHECRKIFSMAKTNIYIVSGEGNSEFFEGIKKTLEMNANKGIDIRLVFGPNLDICSTTVLELAKDKKIKLKRLNKRVNGEHFKIMDDEYLYIADPHFQLEQEKSGYVQHSMIKTSKYNGKFRKLWEKAEDFNIVEIVKTAKPIEVEVTDEGKWGLNAGFIKKDADGKPIFANDKDIEKLREKLKIYGGDKDAVM